MNINAALLSPDLGDGSEEAPAAGQEAGLLPLLGQHLVLHHHRHEARAASPTLQQLNLEQGSHFHIRRIVSAKHCKRTTKQALKILSNVINDTPEAKAKIYLNLLNNIK